MAPLLPRETVRGPQARLRAAGRRLVPRAAASRFAREVLSPERVRAQGYLDPDAVTAVIDEHVSGREDLSRNIWGLVSLSLWLDRYAV